MASKLEAGSAFAFKSSIDVSSSNTVKPGSGSVCEACCAVHNLLESSIISSRDKETSGSRSERFKDEVSVRKHPHERKYPLIAAAIAFVLTAYAPIQAAFLGGTPVITTYFAADAFYYLSIAANSSFGHYTFDGRLMTNGFHPLWQIVLQLIVSRLPHNHGSQPMLASFIFSVLATSTGLAWLGAGLSRLSRAIWPVFLLFPGVYYLLAGQIDPRYGSTWSFINGMESPLSLLFFGMFFYLLVSGRRLETTVNLVILSVLALGILFSRLDDVFLLGSFGAWFVLSQQKTAGRPIALRRLAVVAVPVGVGLAAYLFFNFKTVGMLMPTSGAAKAGLALGKNLGWLGVDGVPTLTAVLHHLPPGTSNGSSNLATLMRLAQMLLPMAMSALLLLNASLRRWLAHEHSSVFAMLSTYVLLKGTYNLLFVPIFNQGHWYYAISVLITDVVLALVVVRFVQQTTAANGFPAWMAVSATLTFAWLASASQVWRTLDPQYQNPNQDLMLARASIDKTELAARLGTYNMIEFDDGILNYALDTPTLSGLGLASNASSVRALKQGTFLSHAADAGYSVIGSINYRLTEDPGITPDDLRRKVNQWPFLRRENDRDDFDYSMVYVDPVSHACFIQFRRKQH